MAPHEGGLKKYGAIDDMPIYCFRNMCGKYQSLAYSGSIQEMMEKNIFSKLTLVSYLIFFFLNHLRLIGRLDIDLIHTYWRVPSGLTGFGLSVVCKKSLIVISHGTDLRIVKSSGLSFF